MLRFSTALPQAIHSNMQTSSAQRQPLLVRNQTGASRSAITNTLLAGLPPANAAEAIEHMFQHYAPPPPEPGDIVAIIAHAHYLKSILSKTPSSLTHSDASRNRSSMVAGLELHQAIVLNSVSTTQILFLQLNDGNHTL